MGSTQEQLTRLTTEQLKVELSKLGRNTINYNTPKQILVDFLMYIKETEEQGQNIKENSNKKRSLPQSPEDNENTHNKRLQVDKDTTTLNGSGVVYNGYVTISKSVETTSNGVPTDYTTTILESSDKAEDIELKLLSNYCYKPILEAFMKRDPNYKGIMGYRLIKEYNRFLTLKILENDYQSIRLYPSPLIDEFWHCHILNTVKYEEFCRLIGRKIHHNPSNKDSQTIKNNKYLFTTTLYCKYFGSTELNNKIWVNTLPHQYNNNNNYFIDQNQDEQNSILKIILVNQYGEKEHYQTSTFDNFQQLMQRYASNKGFNLGVLQYIYKGQTINQNMTPLDLEMKDNDMIQVLPFKPRTQDNHHH